ncbi:hypothetical protein Dimus_003153 [Dionaea muscipula]
MADFRCSKLIDSPLMDSSRFLPISLPHSITPHHCSSVLRFSSSSFSSSSSSSPRLPKPSTLVLGERSSSSTPSSSVPSRVDIVSTSVCSDGSIVFRFGDVGDRIDRPNRNNGAELEVEESLDKVENANLVGELGVLAEGKCEYGEKTSGVIESSLSDVVEADETSGNAAAANFRLDDELSGRYSMYGEDNGNNPSLKGVLGDAAVHDSNQADVVAAASGFGGVLDDEMKNDSSQAVGEVVTVNSAFSSQLGVVTQACDSDAVEEIKEMGPDEEQLSLSLIVEDSRVYDNVIIGLSSISASSEVEQIIDSVEDSIASGRTWSSGSDMGGADASTILQGGTDGNVPKSVVLDGYDPLAMEMLSTTTILPKVEVSVPTYLLSPGAALLPHPSKALTGVDVAHFLAPRNWFGVAAGVAQWSFEGIRQGYYAQELMRNCEIIVLSEDNDELMDVKRVLKKGAAAIHSPGLAAFLIAHFHNQVLHVANVGDTGFCVIRNGFVCKKSYPMVHQFYFPLQIGRDDDPLEVVEEYCVDIEDGDVIVIATAGLFDNLYEQEIASIVFKSVAASMTSEEIAKLLATGAQEVGRLTSARTPFADAAKAIGYTGYCGGKLDAVGVVVLLVQRWSTSARNMIPFSGGTTERERPLCSSTGTLVMDHSVLHGPGDG